MTTHTHIRIHTHVNVHRRTYTYHVHTYVYTHTPTCIYTCTHTLCTYTYTYTHATTLWLTPRWLFASYLRQYFPSYPFLSSLDPVRKGLRIYRLPLRAVRSAQLILLHFISTTAILINNQSVVTSSALRSNYTSPRWNCAGPGMGGVEQISHRPASRLESLPVWHILIYRLSYNDYARNVSFLNRN